MPRLTSILEFWLPDPPRILLVGEGSFSLALSWVIKSIHVSPKDLLSGFGEPEGGKLPQVLGNLEKVILVAGVGDTSADLIRWHEAVWQWIEKLSPEGDQHDVAILFVLADASGSGLADGLALGLGLEKIDPATTGHGIARMGDSLDSLCTTLAAIHPMDLPPLRARRAADERHQALAMLKQAGSLNEPAALRAAVERVRIAFEGSEYLLDLFCRPPSHRNGNQLRGWLNAVVTEEVPPYDAARPDGSPSDWLDEGRFP